MSERAAARHFGVSRQSVRKMLQFSVPPGYRRTAPVRRPKLDEFTALIEQWLGDDSRHGYRKQRHTAKRIFERLRDEHGFTGGYTIVKDYVREHRRHRREMFVPLTHPPGHAQADFGEAWTVIARVKQPYGEGVGMNAAHQKVTASHLSRNAYLYVRQSSLRQVFEHGESTRRQYALRERAVALGWPTERIVVIDSDLGLSGADGDREGFQQLVAEAGMGRAGIVLGLEVSRLARNSADWHRLLEICALSETLILDEDGVYNPGDFNDRLLLGLKLVFDSISGNTEARIQQNQDLRW